MTSAMKEASRFTVQMSLFLSVILAALFFFASSRSAHAAYGVLAMEDKACLNCHAKNKFGKVSANGESASLYVSDKAFSESVHNENGCTDCHAGFDLKKHTKGNNPKIGSREYSIASLKVCEDCHKDNVKLYEGSLHAALVRDGNSEAPICSDCHDPHAVRAKSASGPMGDVVCRNCHGEVFTAYASSVHGHARAKQVGKLATNEKKAPICADCHKAHEIKAAATGSRIKDACLNCHKDALVIHKVWLPNVERHFEAISCAACHVATAKRQVNLRLYDSITNQSVTEKKGVPQFKSRAEAADTKGQGLDAYALQSLLKVFNSDDPDEKTVLRGRLEVSSGVEAHQLVGKDQAIKDCGTCHREGSDIFQTVTISIVRPDGRSIHYDAKKEVLTSPISVKSVSGFYAIGGTRIKLLDVLFVIVLAIGITVPLGHFTLRWLFKKYGKKTSNK